MYVGIDGARLTQTCSPSQRNTHTHTHTIVNYLNYQMGTEHPTVGSRKNSAAIKSRMLSSSSSFFFLFFIFDSVKSISLMLFISEKQITGFHQQLCECIHVFSSGLSLLFPCQCELAHALPLQRSACVCLCACVCVCLCVHVYGK